jgi:hypothetical protein
MAGRSRTSSCRITARFGTTRRSRLSCGVSRSWTERSSSRLLDGQRRGVALYLYTPRQDVFLMCTSVRAYPGLPCGQSLTKSSLSTSAYISRRWQPSPMALGRDGGGTSCTRADAGVYGLNCDLTSTVLAYTLRLAYGMFDGARCTAILAPCRTGWSAMSRYVTTGVH